MSHEYIVAVDFGTSRTGFAWCASGAAFDEGGIHFYTGWPGGQATYKCDSCIETDARGALISWGREAKEKELIGNDDSFFHVRFKMDLYDIQSNIDGGYISDSGNTVRQGPIRIIRNTNFKSLQLIVHFLDKMKEEVLKELQKIERGVDVDSIRWVLTVPANAEEPQKNLMREAAVQAGLIEGVNSDSLMIAVEPETALLAIKKRESKSRSQIERHIKLVIDAGGGTIDVVAYEYGTDGKFRQIARNQAVNAGATYLDRATLRFLENEVFPPRLIDRLRYDENPQINDYYRRLVREIEEEKEKYVPQGDFTLRTVSDIYDFCRSDGWKGREFKSKYVDQETGWIRIPCEVYQEQICYKDYQDVCAVVMNVLEEIVQNRKNGLKLKIYCVGGFSCSESLDKYLRKNVALNRFPQSEWFPREQLGNITRQNAVLQGAVIYGDGLPDAHFDSRISSYAIGIECTAPYSEKYKGGKSYYDDNLQSERVGKVFCPLVQVGAKVKVGTIVTQRFLISRKIKDSVSLKLFYAMHNPTFVDEPNVQKLYVDSFNLAGVAETKRSVIVQAVLGKPEIELLVVEEGTNNQKKILSPSLPSDVWRN